MRKHWKTILIICLTLSFALTLSANDDLSSQMDQNLKIQQTEMLNKVNQIKEKLIQNQSEYTGTLVDSLVYFGNGEKNIRYYIYDENGNPIERTSITKDESGTTTYSTYKTETTYTENGQISEEVYKSLENEVWISIDKEIYTYDGNGYFTEMLYQTWDANSDTWITHMRIQIEINGFNFILTGQEYYAESDQWINTSRMTITASEQININNFEEWENNDSELIEMWDEESSSWVAYYRTNYSYDENRNLIGRSSQRWMDDTSEWIDYEIDTFTYNENNAILTSQYKAFSIWTNEWYLNVLSTNSYDGSGNLVETIDESWNYDTEVWENSGRYAYTYDSNNNMLTFLTQRWDEETQTWTDSEKEIFTYNNINKVETHLKQNKNWGATEWEDDTRSTHEYASNGYLNHFTNELSQGDGNWVPGGGEVSLEFLEIEFYYVSELFVYYNDAQTSIDNNAMTAENFSISQNYPNPFNPTTMINYSIPNLNTVKISVYNAIGQKVSTLVNSKQNAGSYSVNFDGSNLSSGIYFYQITAGNFQQTKQMLLIK